MVSFLIGCSHNNYMKFSGNSDHWEDQYSATIDSHSENGKYIFHYKNGDDTTIFKNLKIVVNDEEPSLNDEKHKGATIQIPSSCNGCTVKDKEPIEVTISWNGNNKENFYLKPDH